MEAQIGAAIGVDESARADPDRVLQLHEQLIHAILGGDPDVIAAEVERHTGARADELVITERNLSDTSLP